MNPIKSKHEMRITLDEENIYFGGMSLSYTLSVEAEKGGRRFYISVKKGDERVECDAGSDFLRAAEHYQSIVHGTVTPCTLEEVLEDLQYA